MARNILILPEKSLFFSVSQNSKHEGNFRIFILGESRSKYILFIWSLIYWFILLVGVDKENNKIISFESGHIFIFKQCAMEM